MPTICPGERWITAIILLAVISTDSLGQDIARQWVLVTPSALTASAKPLIERRRQQGWHVIVVDADRYLKSGNATTGNPTTDIATTSSNGAKSLRRDLAKQKEGFDGKTCVLLLGAWTGKKEIRIPALTGTHNRMRRMLTDHGFGSAEPDGSLTIAVGRLPARSVDEARVMISKLLRFESRKPRVNRVNLIVAHPGGRTKLERTIASNVIRTTVDVRLKRMHPMWQPACIMDVPNSRFQVPGKKFGSEIQRMLEQPHVFCVYSGHSSASGLSSSDGLVFHRDRFKQLKSDHAGGILVCCGCYGCQVTEFPGDGQGYGLSAVRSPAGPVAVIGAFGESYSAMGLLALDGLVNQTTTDQPPELLGDCWLAVQHGITRGEIQPGEFLIHDMADGTGGQVPLKDQRLEHAEMWTLLGDPAMRIPIQREPASR